MMACTEICKIPLGEGTGESCRWFIVGAAATPVSGWARKMGVMKRQDRDAAAAVLACDVCGQLPHPHKVRLTLANVAAMLPIELLVHAAVVNTDLSYIWKVLVLTLTATALVIWVAEPSVRRALRDWLHAPALVHRRRLHSSPALWRVRSLIRDKPGAQDALARGMAGVKADIVGRQIHCVNGGLLDEMVVAVPEHVTQADLLAAAGASGGQDLLAWPTTALALADGQTKALSLAVRVAGDPGELQLAVAELLGAGVVTDPQSARTLPGDGTCLKIPSPWQGPLVFSRPHAPFTLGESARAHRLAELAELTELSRGRRVPAG